MTSRRSTWQQLACNDNCANPWRQISYHQQGSYARAQPRTYFPPNSFLAWGNPNETNVFTNSLLPAPRYTQRPQYR
jgi:hypothetical protein